MKAGLRDYLLDDAAILVACPNVYSFPAPLSAVKPYIMLSRVSETIENTIGESLDIYEESWQVDIIAGLDATAEAIKELVISRLNCADRVEMGAYSVYSCSLTGCSDNSMLEMTGGEDSDIRKTLEFQIMRSRTATPTT